MYSKTGNFKQALVDYNKAVESNPKLNMTYVNRAFVNFKLKNYADAWADTHNAEKLGTAVNPDFIKALQIESGQDK